jgi:hypothetical protein
MAGTTKRRSRPSGERREPHKPVDNEWEKEDEELDLEAQLFGRSKKRAKAGPSKVKTVKEDEASDEDMDDVSLSYVLWGGIDLTISYSRWTLL